MCSVQHGARWYKNRRTARRRARRPARIVHLTYGEPVGRWSGLARAPDGSSMHVSGFDGYRTACGRVREDYGRWLVAIGEEARVTCDACLRAWSAASSLDFGEDTPPEPVSLEDAPEPIWCLHSLHGSSSAQRVMRVGRMESFTKLVNNGWTFHSFDAAVDAWRQQMRHVFRRPSADVMDYVERTHHAGLYMEARVVERHPSGGVFVVPTGRFRYVYPIPDYGI